jgi:hypothetical protein|tara:strand:- start:80 stop:283 length:204 start_codon:yes stop_codon:yes gene_type:complete
MPTAGFLLPFLFVFSTLSLFATAIFLSHFMAAVAAVGTSSPAAAVAAVVPAAVAVAAPVPPGTVAAL